MSEQDTDHEDCKRCHAVATVRDGCDPTDYCDLCAQELVEELERWKEESTAELLKCGKLLSEAGSELAALRKENGELRDILFRIQEYGHLSLQHRRDIEQALKGDV